MIPINTVWQTLLQSEQQDILPIACKEVIDWHNTGLLGSGIVRTFASNLSAEGYPGHECLSIAEAHVLHIAALRVACPTKAEQVAVIATNYPTASQTSLAQEAA